MPKGSWVFPIPSFFKSQNYFLKGTKGKDKISKRGNYDPLATKGMYSFRRMCEDTAQSL